MEQISFIEEQIKLIEKEIEEIMDKLNSPITSFPGIGIVLVLQF